MRLSLEQAKERMEEETETFSSLKQEEKEIEDQIFQIKNEKEAVQRDLETSEGSEQKITDSIAAAQKELEGLRRAESEASSLVSEWELKVQKMRQVYGFKQDNVNRIEEEIARSNSELAEILEALQSNSQDIEDKLHNITEIEKTIEASFVCQTESEKTLKDSQVRREELVSRQNNFFDRREELAERISDLDKEVYRLTAQKEKAEESIDAQINYMWSEYEITLSDASTLRDESMNDLGSMKKQIYTVKDEIKKLGPVNVNAIEDYKNLIERYTFLKTQHDDLVEAERSLLQIISELDASMRKQFTEKFAEINREFDKVFKELFGGGKGTLELLEDEDILEAGVRIIAQPPGKKLQNMMQLSGGEKALTAISLLFAIQNLKPSPFCLLDEIEAALDDSNVGRFAKYLHKLTKNTQFIVITHRRGTMEQVDRLYGITMQEKGVSKLVSVNLIDNDLT